jgi:NTP pyrophosphatase (non-canonical NTP hydrolase)
MSRVPQSLNEAIQAVVHFRNQRGWDEYHTPKELATALSIEASELEEELLWKDSEAVDQYLETPEGQEEVQAEIGDVLIYTLLFCERVGVDPLAAIASKLEKNKEKYPADQDHDF